MDEDVQRVYLDEIMHRCVICHDVMRELDDIASQAGIHRDPFRPASKLIYNAATISKLLWPPQNGSKSIRERAQARGVHLRNVLNIDDCHPAKDRTLRNHFEHYDGRLDDWAHKASRRYVAHQLIAPINEEQANEEEAIFVVQQYDPATRRFAFRGNYFDIQALNAAVQDIYIRAKHVRRARRGA